LFFVASGTQDAAGNNFNAAASKFHDFRFKVRLDGGREAIREVSDSQGGTGNERV
jgi:hypothetical protein